MRKCLILYSSVTGNTETIVKSWESVLLEGGWSCDLRKIDKNTTKMGYEPVAIESYDLVMLGSPIMAGQPSTELIKTFCALGKQANEELWTNPRPQSMNIQTGFLKPKGVVFVTYAGSARGPAETGAALALERQMLEDRKIQVIGTYACPGRELKHMAVDGIADAFHMTVDEAAMMLGRFELNPESAEFQAMLPEQRKALKLCAGDKRDLPSYIAEDGLRLDSRPAVWHWDLLYRPNQRDITKARIFLQEIMEDYFEGLDGCAFSYGQYVCIS